MENANYIKKSPAKLAITMLALGMCWSIVYLVPFLQYTWYDPFKEYLGTTNFRMSLLITIYGFGNVFGAPIGGWVADHFNYKWIYVMSVALNGVFGILFCIFPSYGFAILMWIGFAVASLFMNYPTHIKIVRDLASDTNQGKIFGFNETCIGIGNIVLASLMNVAFVRMGGGIGGLQGAIITNAIISFVLTIIIAVLLDNPKKTGMLNKKEEKKEKNKFKEDFGTVAKRPETWIYAINIFAIYSFLTTLTYFTPYFTDVLGVGVAFSAWMAIFRQYGMQLVGSPIGGLLADKIRSCAKVCMATYVIGLGGFMLLLFVKSGWTPTTIIILTMVTSFAVYLGRGSYYGNMTEVGVPRKFSATTAGVGAVLGFSPDLFQFVLFGHWLDTYGNDAYTRIFLYQTIVLVIGLIAAIMLRKYAKRNNTINGGDYLNPSGTVAQQNV